MKPLDLSITEFPSDFYWYNDQFPPLDALTYWHFLKKANKVIEVGCGYSTILPHKANVELTAIDPQPRIKYDNINYVEINVQDVGLEYFQHLESDDILFIDSSHKYYDGSDVEFLMKTIIPSLKYGVLVHFHDYFGDDGYPTSWKLDVEMNRWNENDALKSFHKFYEVLADNYSISKHYNDILLNTYPFIPTDITQNLGAVRGASLWLKVI